MIRPLLAVATVIDGDGDWTKGTGYGFDDLSCGRVHSTADICTPPVAALDDLANADTGFKTSPFVHTAVQRFPERCLPADAESALTQSMRDAAEYVVTHQLATGDVADWVGASTGVYLQDPGIATVAAGATVPDSIAAALAAAYASHPDMKPIVHLGLSASLSLPPGFVADHPNLTFVEGIGYPADFVAVTGQVTVHLGTIETIGLTDRRLTNRRYISGTRLMSVEFGPCSAVRVA